MSKPKKLHEVNAVLPVNAKIIDGEALDERMLSALEEITFEDLMDAAWDFPELFTDDEVLDEEEAA